MNDKYGWAMNAIGLFWLIAGNPETGTTCFCTAIILFSIKEVK
tara:strand:- start:660 stop:788 length:129 start_codon:yes stop_codon:yes gene_type:complete